MRGADLRRRYDFFPGWDNEALLDILTNLLDRAGMLEEVVVNLDAIAEQEMEIHAGFAQED